MQANGRTQPVDKVLASKILIARLEIMLYALPDDFFVYIDDKKQTLTKPYVVTRSRIAYEYSEESRKRYKELVSPTKMYGVIKRHLEYEKQRLDELEKSSEQSAQMKDGELARMSVVLEQLRKPKGANTLLELQPRYTHRSDDEDELYEEAVSLVARTQIADVTLIRDNLSIGQARADKFMERLEEDGLVSHLSNKALRRRVFITVEDMQEREVAKHATK